MDPSRVLPTADGYQTNGTQNANQMLQANMPGQPTLNGAKPIPKLNREDIVRLIDTLEKMRSSGVDQQDQRYKALATILRAQGPHYNFQQGGGTGFPLASGLPGSMASSSGVGLTPQQQQQQQQQLHQLQQIQQQQLGQTSTNTNNK